MTPFSYPPRGPRLRLSPACGHRSRTTQTSSGLCDLRITRYVSSRIVTWVGLSTTKSSSGPSCVVITPHYAGSTRTDTRRRSDVACDQPRTRPHVGLARAGSGGRRGHPELGSNACPDLGRRPARSVGVGEGARCGHRGRVLIEAAATPRARREVRGISRGRSLAQGDHRQVVLIAVRHPPPPISCGVVPVGRRAVVRRYRYAVDDAASALE